jgi:hypothetical protein
MADTDISMCWLWITIKKAVDYAKKNNIKYLISGSYIEPILWSNPQTLIFLRNYIKLWYTSKYSESDLGRLLKNKINSKFDDKINYDFLNKKFYLSKEKLLEISNLYKLSLVWNHLLLKDIINDDNIFLNYLWNVKISLFNLLTYLDLFYRGHYRNNYINERISIKENINILHPFANRNLRNTIFDLPIEQKFNPNKNKVTIRDNKNFLKKIFEEYMPSYFLLKQKTEGSIPSIYNWLFCSKNSLIIIIILKHLYDRNILDSGYMSKLLKLYIKLLKIYWNSTILWKKKLNISKSIWKLLTLEIYLVIFIDKKFTNLNINEIKLKDYIY